LCISEAARVEAANFDKELAVAAISAATGMYTVLALLASQKTGVALEKIEVALGDTKLPEGPLSGGSMATESVIRAVVSESRNCRGRQ
jgi:xanthine dehydrogenase YagR molybdenum-binding subunit